MSDEPHFFNTSKTVAFDEAAGLLGFATNGAAPQRIFGLFVEADIYGEVGCEPTESYWLKATRQEDQSATPASAPHPEFILFSSDIGQVEAVLGAIASASFVPGYDQRPAGTFEGYHNSAQTEFSDATPDDCVEGLSCRVNSTGAGFEFRLFDRTTTVASVAAKLAPSGIDDVLSVVGDLREWREDTLRKIDLQLSEEPAPAMGM
ncbi:conserved hypothetical protein [Hyphomicrobiales bacterium]|jgi:hypothetical protein|nr:conserved hypothetical protein [Hyphomicrobiales bacterium]CAH1702379.1 conserved hypothetical protein [Hyphomicrobiales bacterium]CAI0346579.1 conserved hypothetical protein [Hyphomicrobiales bacterium]